MNRIDNLFRKKTRNILSIYFTAGYPELDATITIIAELEKNGADLIEIGFPFSDPLADGPVIQRSSEIALSNGMNLKMLFHQLKDIRKNVNIPLILMGYFNPVIQFGVENFCRQASEAGIDGIILPDLPIEIYMEKYKQMFEEYQLCFIPLITPQTEIERIKKIDECASGFLYLVSSSSTTGTKAISEEKIKLFIDKLNALSLRNPMLIGFGIKDKASFQNVCQYANGGIIGTEFIKTLDKSEELSIKIHQFIYSITK
jgi:tryptophan synthase alpha chain